MHKKAIKIGLIITGLISLGFGIIGIFMPLLPTTPFLLLAAACFMRSSDRLYQWLMNHKWFGEVIRDYRDHKTIRLETKIFAMILLWGTIFYSTIFITRSIWVRILLLGIAIAVSAHILHFKTRRRFSEDSNVAE